MSKLSEKTGEPQVVQLPGQVPKSVRFKYMCFKIENDEDAKELQDMFAEGVDIMSQMQVDQHMYCFVRQVIPMKVEL